MNLYVMRHGEAFDKLENPERPLNDQGRNQVSQIAKLLSSANVKIEHIYHSSITRAVQTCEIIKDELPMVEKVGTLSALEPDCEIKNLLYVIDKLAHNTLLIGHLPNLELLSNYLIAGNINTPTITLYPASIACFEHDNYSWILKWLVDPTLILEAFEPKYSSGRL